MPLLGNIVFLVAITIVGFPLAVQHMNLVMVALLRLGHIMRQVR